MIIIAIVLVCLVCAGHAQQKLAECQVHSATFGLVTWPHVVPADVLPAVENGVIDVFSNDFGEAALKVGGEVVTWHLKIDPAVKAKLKSKVTAISVNKNAFAALKEGGEVVVWGEGDSGGDSSAVASELSSNVTAVFSSKAAFAALKEGGEVVTWGDENAGGDSSAVASKLSSKVTHIVSNHDAEIYAALKDGGEVVTWGNPERGGDSSAVASKLRSKVTAISSNLGWWALVALKDGGGVVTWGNPKNGGDSSAVASKLRSKVTAIYHTWRAFAALKDSGEVVTWGPEKFGGDSSSVASKLSRNVTAVFGNAKAFAALKEGGEVVTWGYWLGGKHSKKVEETVESKLSSKVTAIFRNNWVFAALKVGGEVVAWGMAKNGGDTSAVTSKLTSNVTTIFSTGRAFAALKDSGELVVWGHPDAGGDPLAVASELRSNVTTVFSNGHAFAALKDGGQVVPWGNFKYGGDSSAVLFPLRSRVRSVRKFSRSFAALVCIPHLTSGTATDCAACHPNQIWKGVNFQCTNCSLAEVPVDNQTSCRSCNAGSVPNGNGSLCSACPKNTYAYMGSECRECPVGEVPLDHQTSCRPCDAGSAPNSDGSRCRPCPENTYAQKASYECKECSVGEVPLDDKSSCVRCSSGKIAMKGVCKSCPKGNKPNEDQSTCTIDFEAVGWMSIFMLLVSFLGKSLLNFCLRRFVVVDVSLRSGRAILTTLTNHNLARRSQFAIQLHGTGHPLLDGTEYMKAKVARAQVLSSDRLELLDADGCSLNESFDTSKGILQLQYTDMILYLSMGRIPLAIPVSLVFCVCVVLASYRFEAIEAFVMTLAAALGSLFLFLVRDMRKSRKQTPLDRKRQEFQQWISAVNPQPTSCPKGPGRAIRIDKLLETNQFFRSFIGHRTAYYLDANIIKPLTVDSQLSYAELVGPDQVDFFVSHFWGTPFEHFCASLKKHAETWISQLSSQGMVKRYTSWMLGTLPTETQHVAYWICFCSNNQYQLESELGGDVGWQDSSFYLALHSPSCQSLCMVLDDEAMPLTRSWCIFETLQALKLSQSRPDFQFYMCTASGVLNVGNGSIESALGLVHRLAGMDLQDAQASHKADKDMIDHLVLEEMGTFDKLNGFIRDELSVVLKKAEEHCAAEFQSLFHILEVARDQQQGTGSAQDIPRSPSYLLSSQGTRCVLMQQSSSLEGRSEVPRTGNLIDAGLGELLHQGTRCVLMQQSSSLEGRSEVPRTGNLIDAGLGERSEVPGTSKLIVLV